jgi:hypothetical protein
LDTALRELEAVAQRLSIPIRYERGEMRGGLCRLHGRLQIIVNTDLSEEDKADVLAESLAQTDLDTVYLPPRLRYDLEQRRNARA